MMNDHSLAPPSARRSPASADLRLAGMLAIASALSVALVFPYSLVLTPKVGASGLPLWFVIGASVVQSAVQCFGLAWIGLRVGEASGLGAPVLGAWLRGKTRARGHWKTAIGVGVAVAGVLVLLDVFVLLPTQPAAFRAASLHAAWWKGLLASFYGAIVEEVLCRLFLMSLVAWLLGKWLRARGVVVMAASIVAALLFAAGHLPAAAQIAPLSAVVVARVLVLNAIAGLAYGATYARWGIEHAMVAHLATDVLIHGLFG
jgi:membrane protease YdiL (CAAX protease family)